MITYLHGKLAEKRPTHAVIDVHGVGYEVLIPLSSYDRLPVEDEPCRILIHDYVREDAHQLFGFMTEEERSMFCLLMGISGIGPKLALSALSGLSVRELRVAILERDVRRLSSISGIGKRTAERIGVELRDKIGEGEALEALAGERAMAADDMRLRDAVMALVELGYKHDSARKMISQAAGVKLPKDATVEDIIKKALGG